METKDESRRERKKRQTRARLAETAIRLFGEQGYDATTVAQIAAKADVATKTFFNHFPSKEDVLFHDTAQRYRIPVEVIAARKPGESVADLVDRVYEAMLDAYRTEPVGYRETDVREIYTRLIMSVPALQARALHMVYDFQKRIATALQEAYPDELDPVTAAAIVGAMTGATQAAGLTSLELGESEEQFWTSMRRGMDIALRGIVHRDG